MPSFDVVSKVDLQQAKNGVENAIRVIQTRYDFQGSKASIEINGEVITLLADNKMQLNALQTILRERLAKQNVSIKALEFKDPEPASGDALRQFITIKNGLKEEEQKRINKLLKESKLKVSSQIQTDQLRITGKQRDDLQAAITFLKTKVVEIDLQFINFRD